MENLQIYTAAAEDLYDLSMLEEMDDIEYLQEMLTTVLQEVPKDLKEMQQALQTGNIDMVCKQAHKIKSSSGVIQAEKLTAILEEIETAGKKGAAVSELNQLIENAVQQYSRIEKALKKYTNELL
jgi:HPt (histidine-containing phosphotransfer) domain-containing protein